MYTQKNIKKFQRRTDLTVEIRIRIAYIILYSYTGDLSPVYHANIMYLVNLFMNYEMIFQNLINFILVILKIQIMRKIKHTIGKIFYHYVWKGNVVFQVFQY